MAAENATVIGKSVQIRGEVNGSEDLLVDGGGHRGEHRDRLVRGGGDREGGLRVGVVLVVFGHQVHGEGHRAHRRVGGQRGHRLGEQLPRRPVVASLAGQHSSGIERLDPERAVVPP